MQWVYGPAEATAIAQIRTAETAENSQKGFCLYLSNIHRMSRKRHMDYRYNTRKAWYFYSGICVKPNGIIRLHPPIYR